MADKKKLVLVCVIIGLVLALVVAGVYIFSNAGNKDIFYYNEKDKALDKAMKGQVQQMQAGALEYMKDNYTTEYGYPDPGKLTYNTDNMYAMYKWDYESMLGFMKAKNKQKFLKDLEVESIWVPINYDGKALGSHYAKFGYNAQSGEYEYTTENKYNSYAFGSRAYIDKVLMSKREFYHTVKIGEVCFIMIRENDEDLALCIDESYFFGIDEIDYDAMKADPIYTEFRDWFEATGRTLTAREVEYICKIANEIKS